jgi:hypothetical protein
MGDEITDKVVGSGEHEVVPGEDVHSIAFKTGHFWETIWNHPANQSIKQLRDDPGRLLPGDRLVIPPLRVASRPSATNQRHIFRRKGVPIQIEIHLWEEVAAESLSIVEIEELEKDGDKGSGKPSQRRPRVDVPYLLEVGKSTYTGVTDSNGGLKHYVPPTATEGLLKLHPGTSLEEKVELKIGQIYPEKTRMGIKQRLTNLGYSCGSIDTSESEEYFEAIRAFQRNYGLEVTGQADSALAAKLQELMR